MTCGKTVLARSKFLPAVLSLMLPVSLWAGGHTIRLADDSNSRLEIKEAIVAGDRTTVLFWTWPDRGDPGFREECSKNYYTVTLSPGLPSAEPKPLAKGACAGISLLQGGLLSDGSGKFIVRDRLEHWRDGKRLSAESLAEIEHIGSLRLNAADAGPIWRSSSANFSLLSSQSFKTRSPGVGFWACLLSRSKRCQATRSTGRETARHISLSGSSSTMPSSSATPASPKVATKGPMKPINVHSTPVRST